jgi:hypothetical protein
MKIAPGEEVAARQWLARRGAAPGDATLDTWVSALDPRTRKSLSQYLRMRRHRNHVPKVALEIGGSVHSALSDYASVNGGRSLGEAVGQLLALAGQGAHEAWPEPDVEALRRVLAERDNEVSELRQRLRTREQAAPLRSAKINPRVSLTLAAMPSCPQCGGAMRLEYRSGSRFWACSASWPMGCGRAALPLNAEMQLTAAVIAADQAQAWRHAPGTDAAKESSAMKRSLTVLRRLIQNYTCYWSGAELAGLQTAVVALDKLSQATERTARKRKGEEKAEAERA